MNNLTGFLRIPLVKFVCILLILYFALFSNKDHPDALSNRLSKERISEGIDQAAKKSRFIISNVQSSNNIPKAPQATDQPIVKAKTSIEDVELGKGNMAVCGSEVEISYSIFAKDKKLREVSSEEIIIGSNIDKIIEKNILGMQKGGIRNIKVPYNFESDDRRLSGMLNFYKSDLRYQVSLLSVSDKIISRRRCE